MLTITEEIHLEDFDAWEGGRTMLDYLIENDRVEEAEDRIREQYPDGLTCGQLNDLIWFEFPELDGFAKDYENWLLHRDCDNEEEEEEEEEELDSDFPGPQ